MRGFNEKNLQKKFSFDFYNKVQSTITKLTNNVGFKNSKVYWSLTPKGIVISNKVFQELTFLDGEI